MQTSALSLGTLGVMTILIDSMHQIPFSDLQHSLAYWSCSVPAN